MPNLKVLIIGGYGVFGGRLARLLADEARLTLIIAGRSIEKSQAFCHNQKPGALFVPGKFDREGDLATQMRELSPDLVVDASGPFQNYGKEPYRVIKACLAQGIHYLDFADGADFVTGIGQFDEIAKQRDVFILSGVSSFPVLTAAVVCELAKGMKQLLSIEGGIAPSPYAGVGENVIRAIAGYAGQPVKLIRGGKQAIGYGLTETLRYTIAPPGRLPLRNIRFSLVDVPDLQVIPPEWPGLQSIWMGAGPVPEVLHRALNGLAWLVRLNLVPTLIPFSKLFRYAINTIRWGEDRGGMFVAVKGVQDGGRFVERSWHLLAEGSDGPLIPSMSIEAIIRGLVSGISPNQGARAASHEISLENFERLFERRKIYTGRREVPSKTETVPLYKRILQDKWASLPPRIRELHDLQTSKSFAGEAVVERGKGFLSRTIAAIFGFPQAGRNIPVRVDFAVKDGKECWQRTFAGKSFGSVQFEGAGRYQNIICETFGPWTFGLAVVLEDNRLNLVTRRWSIFCLPLPLFLAPRSYAYETEEAGKFHFYVEISLPFESLVVRYRGWLVELIDRRGF